MKAKLRKEQKEKMKTSTSNIQNSSSDKKSQENNNNIKYTNNNNNNNNNININNINNNINNNNNKHTEQKKKRARNRSAEMPNNYFQQESIPNTKSMQAKQIYPIINKLEINPVNQINKEEIKEQELSKLATMFNFEIDKAKNIVKIQENDEYYDMRNQIIELEKDLKNYQKEYDDLIGQIEKKNDYEKKLIKELESELKKNVDYDIEKIKKDNIILLRDINILDKKVNSAYILFQKEQYDITSTIFELDNVIRKLKGELYFVDDLKMRLKNLTSNNIPQELVESIKYVLKEDIAAQYKPTPSHPSVVGSVRTKTGPIPIDDILDISSVDSKNSVKKLYI